MGSCTSQIDSELLYCIPFCENKEGESPIYRHPGFHNELWISFQGFETLQKLLINNSLKYENNTMLGSQVTNEQGVKSYVYKSYSVVFKIAKQLGAGIINLNLIPDIVKYEKLDLKMIGIFAKNREEWFTLDYANMLYGNTMIPLYDTLGIETIPFILNQSQIQTLICSLPSVEVLLKVTDLGKLKTIVTLDKLSEELMKKLEARGLRIVSYEEIIQSGIDKPQEFPEVKPEDIFTLSYTSGTTGNPKGAMISNRSILCTAASIQSRNVILSSQDFHLSYLPLPHVFERLVATAFMCYGATICLYGGDVLQLRQDLALCRPTLFIGVPRIFQKLYIAIKDNLDSLTGIKKSLFEKGYQDKLQNLNVKGVYTHSIWDKLIFNKTKQLFGGRCRYMLTGSAPISGDILEFLKIVACCPVMEGYGQTESCGGSFLTDPTDGSSGHVGGPLAQNEFKIIDVPEMNYKSTDLNQQGQLQPRGEICKINRFRGPNIFSGYFQDPEKTKECLDEEGWLHSGDIVMVLPNGALKIFDRRKNIFKLSQGEYIAPEKIENIYMKVKGINEVFVHGDSLQFYCICIAVPSEIEVKKVASSIGILNGNFNELCQNPEIVKYFLGEIQKQGKADKLNSMENVKKLYLEPQSFVTLNCMTNTMKLQRHQAKQLFKEVIDNLYKD